MDMTWVTDRIAVGGGIWTDEKMVEVARAGITHIIDMQLEWDDTRLAEPYGVRVLWNPTDDDFRPKPPELFQRGVEFALTGAGRCRIAGVHPLRRRGAPRSHDDAGGAAGPGLPAAGCHGHDPGAAPGGGLRRGLRAKRGRLHAQL